MIGKHDLMLTTVRNVAIIAVLALAITVLPAGGNVVEAIMTALSIAFLAAIGLLAARFWRESGMTRDLMDERQRATLYGSLGALALMVAGLDEMLDSGVGTLLWLTVVGVAGYLAFTTWREAGSY